MDEFSLIARFTRPAPRGDRRAGVLLGIGDDCALLAPPRGRALAATVDAVVEGVHFDSRFRPEEIGWKALAVNLSDLAAMGARPLWALCALAVPQGEDPRRLAGVGRGLAACARRFGVALVGGNVTRAGELSVAVTAVGAVAPRKALRRDGARPGDLLFLSGAVGGASLGLHERAPPAARRRQRRPEPRVALGEALAGVASAAIDLSDGLAQDLGHLAAASGAGLRVEVSALPLEPALRDLVRRDPRLLALALAGGEDYELAVTVPAARIGRAREAARRAGVPLTPIGGVVRGRGVTLLDAEGKAFPLLRRGHDHLAG